MIDVSLYPSRAYTAKAYEVRSLMDHIVTASAVERKQIQRDINQAQSDMRGMFGSAHKLYLRNVPPADAVLTGMMTNCTWWRSKGRTYGVTQTPITYELPMLKADAARFNIRLYDTLFPSWHNPFRYRMFIWEMPK